MGRVRQNGSKGQATGVVHIGDEKVWTMHAMGGMVIKEEDAGDFVGLLKVYKSLPRRWRPHVL